MRITITKKLWLCFGLLIIIIALSGLMSYVQFTKINKEVVQYINVEDPLEKAIFEMEINFYQTARAVLDYTWHQHPEAVRIKIDSEVNFEKFEIEFNKLVQIEEQKKLSLKIAKLYRDYKEVGNTIVALADQYRSIIRIFKENSEEIHELIDKKLQVAIDKSSPHAIKKLKASLDMEITIDKAFSSIKDYVHWQDPLLREKLFEAQTDFNQFNALYNKMDIGAEERHYLDQLNENFIQNIKIGNDIMAITDKMTKGLSLFEEYYVKINKVLTNQIRPLIIEEKIKAAENAKISINTARILFLILAILGALTGFTSASIISKGILESVRTLIDGVERFGQGDFIHIIDVKSKDEMGQLAIAFNKMAQKRKRAEEKVRQSEQRLQDFINSSADSFFLFDEHLNFVDVNKAGANWINRPKEDIVGRNILDISPMLGQIGRYEKYQDVLKTGNPFYIDDVILALETHKGNYFSIKAFKVGRGLGIIAFDITDRKQTLEMLRSERDKLEVVLNCIGEGMYIVNQDFIIEYQNVINENLYPHAIGKKCYRCYMHSNEPCDFCVMKKSIDLYKIHYIEAIFSNGKNYDITFSPFTDINNDIKVIILTRDITEKKTLQAEAMRAGHLASLGELAAGVAHEINNPINGIISYAEVLNDQCSEQDFDTEIPNRIIKEGDRIAKIVNNLLSFSRSRTNEYSPAHIKDILSDSLGLVERQISKDGITIRIDVPPDLPTIKARHQEIQQVFLNIFSNARYALNQRFPEFNQKKFLEIRGEMLKIEGQSYVRITFHDNGIGISKHLLDKIMEPFFSTKPRGEGTGLGLSISHGIIRNHGGRLFIESNKGEYTKVIVDLPVDKTIRV
ncbi:MAG: ATP-binding protein [bacterium]